MRIYHIILLLLSIVAAIILSLEAASVLIFMIFIYFLIFDRDILARTGKLLKKPTIWVLIILLLIVNPLLSNGGSYDFIGLGFSDKAFLNGLRMILRALLIISAFNYFRKYNPGFFSPEKVNGIPGLGNFGRVFEETKAVFPETKNAILDAWKDYREKEKGNRPRASDFVSGIFISLLEKQHEKNK